MNNIIHIIHMYVSQTKWHLLLSLLLLLWFIIDVIRYVKYKIIYKKMNTKIMDRKDINKKNIGKLFDDFKNYPELIENNLIDIFYSKIKIEDMNYNDVCESLYSFTNNDPTYVDDVKKIVKKLQINERQKNNRIIFKNSERYT